MKLTFFLCSFFLRYFLSAFVLIPSVDASSTKGGAEELIEVYYVDHDGEATTDVNTKIHGEENKNESSHEDNSFQESKDKLEKWFESTKAGKNDALTEPMVTAVWGLYQRWCAIALKRRRSISFYKRLAVILVSTGAVLQTLSHQLAPPYEWISSLVAGACLGIAPFVTQQFLCHEKINEWTASRKTAEALKAEVFKFRAGVKPYNEDDSVEILALTATQILEPTAEIDTFDKKNINTILGSPVGLGTKKMFGTEKAKLSTAPKYNTFDNCNTFAKLSGMHPPPDLRTLKEAYIETRLKPQVECHFRKRAASLRRLTIFVKTIQHALSGASSGIAFIAARSRFLSANSGEPSTWLQSKLSHIGVWGAVMTTIAAAIGTQFATSKLDEVASEFRDAANEIERKFLVMSSKNIQTGTKEWENFVIECEEIIADTYRSLKNLGGPSKKSKLTIELENGEAVVRKWDPSARCVDKESGSHSAGDRAKWLVDNKDYALDAAKAQVMKEFPDVFKL